MSDYAVAIGCVDELIYKRGLDLKHAATLRLYYEMLYSQRNLDSQNIMRHVKQLNFETIREGNEQGEGGFRLINSIQIHLVVEYGSAQERSSEQEAVQAIREANASDAAIPRWASRRLQNFVVSVFPETFDKLRTTFPFALSHLYLNYYVWTGDYSERVGLGNIIESLRAESLDE